MNLSEKDKMKQWVQTWQQADEALTRIRIQELRRYDYQQHWQIVDSMLQWAFEHRTERLTSGLVEQQYWFMKLREQQQKAGAV